jgi:hypothetical protein
MLRERRDQLLMTAYLAAARSDAKIDNHLARQVLTAHPGPPTGAEPGTPAPSKP